MKKLSSLLLALLFFTNTSIASTIPSVREAINELEYELVVEWDQKDLHFRQEALWKFSKRISDLKALGLTVSDFLVAIDDLIIDKQLLSTLKDIYARADWEHFPKNDIYDLLAQSKVSGASWNGNVTLITSVGIAALFVGFAVYTIATSDSSGGGGSSGNSGCTFNTNTMEWWCPGVGGCYYNSQLERWCDAPGY